MAGEPDPNWPRQALRGFLHEWASYARAAVAVTIAPVRSMGAWADGERELLNPLVCLLNAIAIITVADVLVRVVRHVGDDSPPWWDLLEPALRLFNTAVVASLLHLPLKLLGARRRWRTTFGAALYVSAGPMVPLYIVANALLGKAPPRGTPAPPSLLAFAVVMTAVFTVYLIAAAAGAHRLRWWRALLATAIGAGVLVALSMLLKLALHR
jgi:hypothetical protein